MRGERVCVCARDDNAVGDGARPSLCSVRFASRFPPNEVRASHTFDVVVLRLRAIFTRSPVRMAQNTAPVLPVPAAFEGISSGTISRNASLLTDVKSGQLYQLSGFDSFESLVRHVFKTALGVDFTNVRGDRSSTGRSVLCTAQSGTPLSLLAAMHGRLLVVQTHTNTQSGTLHFWTTAAADDDDPADVCVHLVFVNEFLAKLSSNADVRACCTLYDPYDNACYPHVSVPPEGTSFIDQLFDTAFGACPSDMACRGRLLVLKTDSGMFHLCSGSMLEGHRNVSIAKRDQ